MSNSKPLSEYDQKLIEEIAHHIVSPTAVQKLLSVAGMPVEMLMQGATKVPVVKKLPELVNDAIQKGLRITIKVSGITYSEKGIISEFAKLDKKFATYSQVMSASLKTKDKVADSFDVSNAVIVGAEGAIMGAATSICELFPGAQIAIPALIAADVMASMTFLSRHASQVAASYGFPASDPVNVAHIISGPGRL